MQYQGQELVSRSTEVSNRSLVALAIAKILVVGLSIELNNFNLFGVVISYENFDRATTWVLCLLLVNHLLSWFGDYRSFQGWNSNRKKTGSSTLGVGGSSLRSELDYALDITKNLKITAEKATDDTLRDRLRLLEEYNQNLEKMVQGAEALSTHARLYLFGWFLALPVLLGFSAIFADELFSCL